MKTLKNLSLTLILLNVMPSFAGDGVCPADRQDVCTKVIEVLNDALNKGLITKDQWDYEHLHLDIDFATYQRMGLESQFGGQGRGITSNQPEHMLIKDILTKQTDKEFFDLVLGVLDEAKLAWGQGGKTLPRFYIAAPDGSESVSAAIDKTAPPVTPATPMMTLNPAVQAPSPPVTPIIVSLNYGKGPSGVGPIAGKAPDIVGASGGLKVPPKPAAQTVPTPKPTPVAAPKPLPAKTHKIASTNSKVVAYHLMQTSKGSKGLHKTVSIVKQHPSKPTDNKTHKKSDVSKSHPEMPVSKKPGAPHLQDEKSFSQDESGRLWSCTISDMGMRRMVDIHGNKIVTGHSETLQYSSRLLNHVPGLHVRDNRCLITVHK
ncbi:hypothetical protein XMD579_001659 [Marinobacterium sp. xm-d-579]|uniref:hypothetical protein n=1 Tax=Marinobacterium sp. xm-d-579 TaxID=2497734 RepID=UPI00156A0FC0|nr:hypothetical protein [Marinobacterium sp. xm-d-579]NRP36833.1 hypothetical protein [Marinobacterium sp. xm-d-579]